MTAEKFKRKLTAILSADVKGYSRLMGEDEEGTIRTLNAYIPKFSVDNYAKVVPFKVVPFKDPSETDKFINALRKAGLK